MAEALHKSKRQRKSGSKRQLARRPWQHHATASARALIRGPAVCVCVALSPSKLGRWRRRR
eukprot:8162809-Alexandrium_andersonii.AAC.1